MPPTGDHDASGSRVLCVFNPRSREGLVRRLWDQTRDWLLAHGCEPVVVELAGDHLAADFERLLTGQISRVIGIGGDGTHLAVLNALRQWQLAMPGRQPPPYALVPGGTGNDVAKSLGLRVGLAHLPHALHTALHGEPRRFDLGQWQALAFADALCVGLDAAVLARRIALMASLPSDGLLGRCLRGYGWYLLAGLQCAWQTPSWQATLALDGQQVYHGPMANLVINNTPVHAGEFEVTPGCRPDDGLLHVVLFTSRWRLLWGYATGLRLGPAWLKARANHRAPPHRPWTAREIRVTLSQTSPVQVDGELYPAVSELLLTCLPQVVTIMYPRPSAAAS